MFTAFPVNMKMKYQRSHYRHSLDILGLMLHFIKHNINLIKLKAFPVPNLFDSSAQLIKILKFHATISTMPLLSNPLFQCNTVPIQIFANEIFEFHNLYRDLKHISAAKIISDSIYKL